MSALADLVLDVSDDLATLAPEEVDQAIDRALGRLGDIAGAGRAYVFLLSEGRDRVSNTHEWCAERVEPARDQLQDLPLDTFPVAFGMLLHEARELAVPEVAAFEEGPEREEWDRERIQSLFLAPLRVHGEVTGFVGMDWVVRADPLEPETRQLVRVLGALVASALERRRAFRTLEYRLRFEDLVLQISSHFVDVRGDSLTGAVDRALESIARFCDVEVGYVQMLALDGSLRPSNAWRVGPVPIALGDDATAAAASVPWWLERLSEGNPVAVADTGQIPEELAELRGALANRGIGSVVDVPILIAGRLAGVVGFASAKKPRPWAADEVKLLQHFARVLAAALSRSEAERNEARLEEQLRQTLKLESVGQLAGGIAHDFNNLLVAINLSAELAMRALPREAGPTRDALKEIQFATERAAALTRQLLAFSRRQVVQKRPIDLNAVVADLLKMLRRIVPESIEIELAPGADLGTVRADRNQIEQVILNLCVNAGDAMSGGGKLTLRTRNAVLEPGAPVRQTWTPPGDYVVLAVEDTGAGIDPATKERLFEPFFTTKPPGSGTGLGLSTAYGIVRQHDGLIHVVSTPGRGSVFSVYLPRVEQPAEEAVPSRQAGPAGGAETILVAEDDDVVRWTVTQLLRHGGYRVLEARDGLEAAALHAMHAGEIGLVILDAIMPHSSGLEAYRAMVQRQPDVRVLFTSGYSTSVFPPGFFDDGTHQMLDKPYAPDALLQTVRELLDRGRTPI